MENWPRLGAFLRRERQRRGLNQAQFAEFMGLSVRTVGALETGARRAYDANTITAIEDCLSWQPGSVARVLAGREPVTSDPQLAAIQAAWPHLSTDARAMLAELATRGAKA